jgi:hypothetical protein
LPGWLTVTGLTGVLGDGTPVIAFVTVETYEVKT